MNITVKIDAKGLEEAINSLADALKGKQAQAIHQVTESVTPKQDELTKEDKPKQKKAPAKEPEPEKEAPKKAESKFTLETVTKKAREVITSGDANKAEFKTWLTDRDLKKVSELPESQYDEFMTFAEELLG